MDAQTVYRIEDFRVTAESVAQAKADCLRQRREVEQQTGLRIRDDGQIAPLVIIHCPRCAFAASAQQEGRAIGALVGHLKRVHFWAEMTGGAA